MTTPRLAGRGAAGIDDAVKSGSSTISRPALQPVPAPSAPSPRAMASAVAITAGLDDPALALWALGLLARLRRGAPSTPAERARLQRVYDARCAG